MVRSDTRRRLLRGIAAGGGVTLFGGLLFGDDALQTYREWQCPQRRDPTWSYDSRQISTLMPAAPVFAGQLAYIALGHGVTTGDGDAIPLVAVDRRTGRERWQFSPGSDGTGLPLVTDSHLYVGTGSDKVVAVDRATKSRRWTYDAGGQEQYGGGAWGQPALVGERLVVGISHSALTDPDPSDPDQFTNRIVGLDPADGTLEWELTVETDVFAGPTVLGDDLLVVTRGGAVYRLSARDGSVRWQTETAGSVRTPPRVREETVYVAADSCITALDSQSGEHNWTVTLGTEHSTEPSIVDDGIVVGDDGGSIRGFSFEGTERWKVAALDPVGGLCTVESTVYALAHTGRLHAIDATDGTLVGESLVVERVADQQCGWFPDTHSVLGLATDGEALYPATRSWVRRYSLP